ncbi:hypothetical protein L9F63_022686, partial [Diploptera punctata]
ISNFSKSGLCTSLTEPRHISYPTAHKNQPAKLQVVYFYDTPSSVVYMVMFDSAIMHVSCSNFHVFFFLSLITRIY